MNYNLSTVYNDLITGKISCKEASEIMKSQEVQKLISSYLYKDMINKLVPYFEEDLQNIYMIINISQYIYNNSGIETGLSDNDYDILYSIMLANGGSDVVSAPIVPSSVGIAYHKYPALRGTLTKTYYLTKDEERKNPSRRYLDEWKSSMESKIFTKSGKTVDLDNEEIYVFPKFDGVSGIFEMDSDNNLVRVLTRGFTQTNEAKDITHVFANLPKREHSEFRNQEYGLKTEIMMQEKDLEYFNSKYGTDYKNTRSIVSAIINSDEYDEEKSSLLHVVPLRVGDIDGNQELAVEVFDNYPYLRCRLKDRELIRKFANDHSYVNGGLRCDGAVIHIINPELQEILGRENDKNNYEVAYKFTEESTFSELKDVTFNVGLFGRVAPVARVKPVKLKGNKITNISLGSIGRLRDLQLRKGDKVKVLYDIIPYLTFDMECEHNEKGELIEIPEVCPECGEPLKETESSDIIYCDNDKCPCRMKGKILNYLNKMMIDNISYGIIDKLYECGYVKNIKDIYSIEKNKKKISKIRGFGDKSVDTWIESINSKRNVKDYIMLGSLGIEGISTKTFQKIFDVMTLDDLLDIVDNNQISKLVTIKSIQEKTAMKIIEGINSNKKLIKFLEDELDIISTKGTSNEKSFSVCFTKIRDMDLEKFIIDNGGIVSDSLTKNTTFLVVPSLDTESSKVSKAKKYGIQIVHIDDLESTILNYLNK